MAEKETVEIPVDDPRLSLDVDRVRGSIKEIEKAVTGAIEGDFDCMVKSQERFPNPNVNPVELMISPINSLLNNTRILLNEQREREKEIQEKVRYLNMIPTMVAVLDLDGKMIFVNDAPLKPLGLTMEEMLGRKFVETEWWNYSSEQQEKIRDSLVSASMGESVTLEAAPMLGEEAVPIKFTSDPVRNDDGEIYAILATGTPILEQKAAMEEVEEKLRVIEAQQAAIKELSTPVMEVWEGVLCLPIVGMVDSARAAAMTETLLDQVVDSGAECVIIDLTGIDIMDTMTAGHFIKMARSIRLLGADPMLTGISPAVAQTLVQIGVELSDVKTLRNLREGLRVFLSRQKRSSRSEGAAASLAKLAKES